MEQIPSNEPVMDSAPTPGPAGWMQIWIKAVTKPSDKTFAEIVDQPGVSVQTAFIWVFIGGIISGISQALVSIIRNAMGTTPAIPGFEQFSQSGAGGGGSIFFSAIIGLCVSPIITVVAFAISTALIQWVAKLFGGIGTFEKQAYAFASVSVPATVVMSILSILSVIPYVGACFGFLTFGVLVYLIVLNVMAVKGVNQFGWGQAVGSVFIPAIAIGLICGCLVAGSLMLLGPAINDAFNQINQGLVP